MATILCRYQHVKSCYLSQTTCCVCTLHWVERSYLLNLCNHMYYSWLQCQSNRNSVKYSWVAEVPISLAGFQPQFIFEVQLYSHLKLDELITANLCTCHDSCAVVSCAKICSNIVTMNGVPTAQLSCHVHKFVVISPWMKLQWNKIVVEF